MRIGILAYHAACNFGASLQLLSTYMFLKKKGHRPVVINWLPEDLERSIANGTPIEQQQCQQAYRKRVWTETPLCRTPQDVADVIRAQGIEAVIIGSDAVAQHHPLIGRIAFPCRTIITVDKVTSDRKFPNAFWGVWQDHLDKPVPLAVMSASSQDSLYRFIPCNTRREMARRIEQYNYLSVRDEWTADMMKCLTKGKRIPPVTPDPVFSLNQNAAEIIPTREETLEKYNLPEKYLLLSFLNKRKPSVTQHWIDSFTSMAQQDGLSCAILPFSHGDSFGNVEGASKISLPLDPLHWYALIKYSQGYVGNNMHPIIVALHNNVPFFSLDTYGMAYLKNIWVNDNSSKIKHLLTLAHLQDYRAVDISRFSKMPDPEDVYHKITHFDKQQAKAFADEYHSRYDSMMNDILNAISH